MLISPPIPTTAGPVTARKSSVRILWWVVMARPGSCSFLDSVSGWQAHWAWYSGSCRCLWILHWLRLPQRVDYKVAVMAFRVLHGLAPPYLDQLVRVADLSGCHRLRSSTSYQLRVPAHRLVSAGRRSFPAAAAIPGTLYHLTSSHRPRCLSFNND